MAPWSTDDLDRIAATDEVDLESQRRDGTLRAPVTIWVVRDGDDLYVRSVKGREGPWYRGARTRRQGRIHAGGFDRDVTFTEVPDGIAERLDIEYRAKYGRYPKSIVDSVLTPQARAATLRILPR